MKAVRLYEYGSADKLKYELDAPDPGYNDNEVLIATTAISINPIDWKMRSGAAKERFPVTFPAILGRDVSGLVRAVGAKVTDFKIGDRVMAFGNATYAELVAVPAADVTHIPDGLDMVDAAALPLIVNTGDQLVRITCDLKRGDTVLVAGAVGGVGRVAVHSAKLLGAKVIAGVRTSALDEARQLGADAVVAIDDPAALQALGHVDALADCVGGDTATRLLAHVKDGGICGTVVAPGPDSTLYPLVRVLRRQLVPDAARLRLFAEDVRDGKFTIPIARRMPLADTAEAHALAEKPGLGGKIILMLL